MRRVTTAKSFFLLISLLLTSACQGSWADQIVVHLNPVGKAGVKGIAIVAIGKECDDQGNCRFAGSNLMMQLTQDNDASSYHLILAEGDCSKPPSTGSSLAQGDGDILKVYGMPAHVGIPIHELTGGTYIISVLTSNAHVVACGLILREGLF